MCAAYLYTLVHLIFKTMMDADAFCGGFQLTGRVLGSFSSASLNILGISKKEQA